MQHQPIIFQHLPMPIETPRLLLRPPRTGDEIVLNMAIIESFELLNKYMWWAREKPSLDDSKEVIRKESKSWSSINKDTLELMILIFDKNTHDFIGATGFHNIDWTVPCIETGYWIRKKYAGKGFMTEAVNALTQYAFKVLKVSRIAITCDPDNVRSKKIPESLGYIQEARLKFNRRKFDTQELADTLVYARYDLNQLPDLLVNWTN